MSRLSQFLESASAQGRLDSSGEFSVAQEKRLERFQNAIAEDPGNFALKIVQGLVALGAESIQCQLGASSLTVCGSGCRGGSLSLVSRFTDSLGDRRDALDDLAMGVLGAMKLSLGEIGWQLAGGESVIVNSDGPQVLAHSNEDSRTIFQFKFVSESLWRTLKNTIKLRISLHHALTTRCSFSPIPIKLGFRAIKPAEFGGEFRSNSSPVGSQRVFSNVSKRFEAVNKLASYTYRYWGRLDVLKAGDRPGFTAPALGSGTQFSLDGRSGGKLPPRSVTYYAFIQGHARRNANGFLEAVEPGEGYSLKTAVFLVADPKASGSQLGLVHRGVMLQSPEVNLGSAAAVAISAETESLQLDAGTLSVVRNEAFDQLLTEIRHEVGFLTQAVFRHRELLPPGASQSLKRVYEA